MKLLAFMALSVAIWFVEAWALMVAVGMIHGAYLKALPLMGYPTALIVSLALSIVGSVVLGGRQLLDAVIDE